MPGALSCPTGRPIRLPLRLRPSKAPLGRPRPQCRRCSWGAPAGQTPPRGLSGKARPPDQRTSRAALAQPAPTHQGPSRSALAAPTPLAHSSETPRVLARQTISRGLCAQALSPGQCVSRPPLAWPPLPRQGSSRSALAARTPCTHSSKTPRDQACQTPRSHTSEMLRAQTRRALASKMPFDQARQTPRALVGQTPRARAAPHLPLRPAAPRHLLACSRRPGMRLRQSGRCTPGLGQLGRGLPCRRQHQNLASTSRPCSARASAAPGSSARPLLDPILRCTGDPPCRAPIPGCPRDPPCGGPRMRRLRPWDQPLHGAHPCATRSSTCRHHPRDRRPCQQAPLQGHTVHMVHQCPLR